MTNEQIAQRAVENAETAAQIEITDPELRASLIRNFAKELDNLTLDSMKADKIMTRKEYFDLPLYHWHSVCWDYDGVGSVGIKYDGRSPPRS